MENAFTLAIAMALLFLAYIAPSRRLRGGWSSPVVIYHGTWAVLFFLDSLPIIHYNELSSETLWLVIISHVTFALGSATACVAAARAVRSTPIEPATFLLTPQQETRFRRVLQVMMVIGLTGSLMYARHVTSYFGGIRGFLLDSHQVRILIIRGEIGSPLWISLLRTFNYAYTPLCAYYLFATRRWRTVWLYIPLASVWVESVASYGRTLFLWNMLLFVSALMTLYAAKWGGMKRLIQLLRQSAKLILVSAILIVLVWSGANLIRQMRGQFDNFENTVSRLTLYTDIPLSDSPLFNSLVSNYALTTGGLHAFNEIVEDFDGRYYWGAATLESFIDLGSKITGTDLMSRRIDRYRIVNIPFDFNVHTFLREPFEDGGLIGILLFSYFLGAFSTAIYIRWYRTRLFATYTLLAFVSLLLEYSIIVNLLSAASMFWMGAIIAYISTYLIHSGDAAVPVNSRRDAASGPVRTSL